MPFQVILNPQQPRVEKQRIGFLLGDTDLSGGWWENIWQNPVNNAVTLRPNCLLPAFSENTTGIYTRWGLTQFGLTSGVYGSGGYIQASVKEGLAATRIQKASSTGSQIVSTSNLKENQGFYFSFFNFQSTEDNRAIIAEWGVSTAASGIYFRAWNSGEIDVYGPNATEVTERVTVTPNQDGYVNLMFLPLSRQVILFDISSWQGKAIEAPWYDTYGFVFPEEKFWFSIPASGTVDIEMAPVNFPSSGYGTTKLYSLAEAPTSGSVQETWNNDSTISTLTNYHVLANNYNSIGKINTITPLTSSFSAFTPNGTTKQLLWQYNLTTTDSAYTPWLYGFQGGWLGTTTNTASGEELDITSCLNSIRLEVRDGIADSTLRLGGRYDLLTDITSGYYTEWAENWPVELRWNGRTFWQGYTNRPSFTDGPRDEIRRYSLECKERLFVELGKMFRDKLGFNGLPIEDGFKKIIEQTTFSSSTSLSSAIFPVTPAANANYDIFAEVGQTYQDAIDDIRSKYTPAWFCGVHPLDVDEVVFAALDEVNYRTKTLYRSDINALAASGAVTDVYFSFESVIQPSEANEVRVYGFDPYLKRGIAAVKIDTASQNPTTSLTTRPDNWTGDKRVVAWANPRLTSQAQVNAACENLFAWATLAQESGEIDSWFQVDENDVPYWRGDTFVLENRGTYLINSFSVDVKFLEDGKEVVKANYSLGAITYQRQLNWLARYYQKINQEMFSGDIRWLSQVAVQQL